MKLNVKWYAPIPLKDGRKKSLIYIADNLDEWRDIAGVYMFAKVFDGKVSPLYIGKGKNLGGRIWQHFKSSTALMNELKNKRKHGVGTRVVILGEFQKKSGQEVDKCIGVIERALIDHALNEGYTLINVHGTRTPTHQLDFAGYLPARNITGQTLSVRIDR